MKDIIVNILLLILMFNIIMVIFPEGKTQKFCRITIKIFIMIYILDNIFLSKGMDFKMFEEIPTIDSSYEREVSINNVDQNFIDSINENEFEGDDVVKNITLKFTDDMEFNAVVELNKLLSMDEKSNLKTRVAEIFQISFDKVYLR